MMLQRIVLSVAFLLNCALLCVAQDTIPIEYIPAVNDSQLENLPQELDSTETEFVLLQIKKKAQDNGYYAASIDSFVYEDGVLHVYFYLGQKLEIRSILVDSFIDYQKSERNWNQNSVMNAKYEWKESERILNELAKQGYPLAFFTKKKVELDSTSLQFEWNLSKGPKVRFGQIILKDSSVLSKSYLERLLKIKPGAPFNISMVEDISSKMSNLDFIKLKRSPKIVLVGNEAEVHLDVVSRNASVFNFLLGVLPSNSNGEQRFTISGELTGHFKNKLKFGEELYIHFNQLKKEKQRIEFALKYPFILRSPIGVSSKFHLFRNEKSTIDQLFQIGSSYGGASGTETTFYSELSSSRLLYIDTMSILETLRLPSNLDVSQVDIGIHMIWSRLDIPLNPRKGWFVDVDISGGQRKVIPNQSIRQIVSDDVDFSTAYDSINTNSLKMNVEWKVQKFIPIKDRSTLLLQNQLSYTGSPSTLYLNEYYRLGGANSIRGFDDQSLVASFLSYLTAEYRYLLGESAYLSAFLDYGYMYNPILIQEEWNSLLGFGLGLSFQVPAGVFSIEFALGQQQRNPIDFRNTKSHFGFVTLF